MDWQASIAAAIVALTFTAFLVRLVRPRRRHGCDHGCGCGKKSSRSD